MNLARSAPASAALGACLLAAVAAAWPLAAGAQAPTPSEARARAITWLLEHQNPSGSWGEDERSEVLTTAVALEALQAAGVARHVVQLRRAEAWLANRAPRTTADLAHVVVALAGSDLVHDAAVAFGTELNARQVFVSGTITAVHGDVDLEILAHDAAGPILMPLEVGWGATSGALPNLLDSMRALWAMKAVRLYMPNVSQIPANKKLATAYLCATQAVVGPEEAGSWSFAREPSYVPVNGWVFPAEDPGREVFVTAWGLLALNAMNFSSQPAECAIADQIAAAKGWLLSQQNLLPPSDSNGGWGKAGVSNVEETALVYRAFRDSYVVGDPDLTEAIDFLISLQLLPPNDGSWDSKAYPTALALHAIAASGLATDTDGDGIPDAADPDDDGDGTDDYADAFPLDASETQDLDGDGIGDNADPDRDGDGFCDGAPEDDPALGVCSGVDGFPDDPTAHTNSGGESSLADAHDPDLDGDGVENDKDAFPLDPNESIDTDRDGIGDAADPDDDNDGVLDDVDVCPLVWDALQGDQDGDGLGDACACDLNGDRRVDLADALLAMRILGGSLQPTPEQAANADVAPASEGPRNGVVDLGDALVILRAASGESIPACGIPAP